MLFNPDWKPEVKPESETRRNLKELSRLLRHSKEWPEGYEWDFETCGWGGESGCAICLWENKHGINSFAQQITSCMPWDDECEIFYFFDNHGSRNYPVAYQRDVTPLMVANAIDRYLETHDV